MGSTELAAKQLHAVCLPFPVQGQVNPMMQLAKLLHSRGFHITFVNTEFNHRRLIRSRGPDSVKGLPDFQFATIPDGLPPSDKDATQDVVPLCDSIRKTALGPFKELVTKLNSSPEVPEITCIVSDGITGFGREVAKELGIPEVQFLTASACGFMAFFQYSELVKRGIVPFKGIAFACTVWGIGMEVNNDVRRDEIEALVKAMLEGEKGMKMRQKAKEWKKKALEATDIGGSSYNNFDRLIKDMLSNMVMDY